MVSIFGIPFRINRLVAFYLGESASERKIQKIADPEGVNVHLKNVMRDQHPKIGYSLKLKTSLWWLTVTTESTR